MVVEVDICNSTFEFINVNEKVLSNSTFEFINVNEKVLSNHRTIHINTTFRATTSTSCKSQQEKITIPCILN